jgi:hypothetical protein
LAGFALLATATFAMLGGWWTPLAARYVQGVDVSHHQGAIDWRTLAADDIAFAYIKATEGTDHVDARFAFIAAPIISSRFAARARARRRTLSPSCRAMRARCQRPSISSIWGPAGAGRR